MYGERYFGWTLPRAAGRLPERPIENITRAALFVAAVPQAITELTSAKKRIQAPGLPPQYWLPNASHELPPVAVYCLMMFMSAPAFQAYVIKK